RRGWSAVLIPILGIRLRNGTAIPKARWDMTRIHIRRLCAALVAVVALAAARMSYAADDTDLINQAKLAIAEYRKADPGLDMFFTHSAGYVVFPGIGKGGLVVGGAYGNGVVFEGGRPVGKATLKQVSVGPQIGGQEYSEIIFFQTPQALADFKAGKTTFAAN